MALTTTMVQGLAKALAGFFHRNLTSASDSGNVPNALDFFTERQATFVKAGADALAATETAALVFFRAPQAIRVKDIYLLPGDDVTAHAANFATFIVASADGAGGEATARATFATDTVATDDLSAMVPKLLTTVDFNMSAGEILTFEITKDGDGVIVPQSAIVVTYVLR